MKTKTRNPLLIRSEIFQLIPKKGEISAAKLKVNAKNGGTSYRTLYKYLNSLCFNEIVFKRNEGKKVFYRRREGLSEYHKLLLKSLKNYERVNKKEIEIFNSTAEKFAIFIKTFTEIVWQSCNTQDTPEQATKQVKNTLDKVPGYLNRLVENCFMAHKCKKQNNFSILDYALADIEHKMEQKLKMPFI